MDRMKLMEAILKRYEEATAWQREGYTREALKYMSDSNLVVFANEIGVDTDVLFS